MKHYMVIHLILFLINLFFFALLFAYKTCHFYKAGIKLSREIIAFLFLMIREIYVKTD